MATGAGKMTCGESGSRYAPAFRPYDILSLAFLILIDLLIMASRHNLDRWSAYVVLHLLLAGLILAIVMAAGRFRSRVCSLLRDAYPFFLLFFLFEEMERFTHLIFHEWQHHFLIAADRFVFGVDPTVWLERIIWPPLSEFLQLIYCSYYALLPVGGLLLLLLARRALIDGILTAVSTALYLCFIGYVLLPAEGPWKTLASLQTVTLDDSLFYRIVAVIQRRGGIVGGCFPSAHVSLVFAVLFSFFFFWRRAFYVFLPYSVLLAFATVYGRYHYAVDGLVGMVIGFFGGLVAARFSTYPGRGSPPREES